MPIPTSPQLKLDRAKEHLRDFYLQFSYYNSFKPYQPIREMDADGSGYTLKLGLCPPIPTSLSAIAGDAVHNMRAFLDHLVWELVRANHRNPDSDTMFPISANLRFRNNKPAFFDYAHKMICKCDPLVQDIIEALQPYHRGDDAKRDLLWVLNDFDRFDKHRTLQFVVGQYRLMPTEESRLIFDGKEVDDPSSVIIRGRLDEEGILGHFSVDVDPNQAIEPYLSARMGFDFDGPGHGASPDILWRICAYLERDVVPGFERFFS